MITGRFNPVALVESVRVRPLNPRIQMEFRTPFGAGTILEPLQQQLAIALRSLGGESDQIVNVKKLVAK